MQVSTAFSYVLMPPDARKGTHLFLNALTLPLQLCKIEKFYFLLIFSLQRNNSYWYGALGFDILNVWEWYVLGKDETIWLLVV